jgi:hypothetical protein
MHRISCFFFCRCTFSLQIADELLHCSFALLRRIREIYLRPSADIFAEDRVQQRIQFGQRKRPRMFWTVALARYRCLPDEQIVIKIALRGRLVVKSEMLLKTEFQWKCLEACKSG